MKPNKELKNHWRDLCASLSEDDGLTPDELQKLEDKQTARSQENHAERSNRRLCAQAKRAIYLSLLADCHDEDLQSLEVHSVEPNPDAKRLRINLTPLPGCTADMDTLARKIAAVAHILRHAVAQSLSRKKSPHLSFSIEPASREGGLGDD